MQITNHTQRHRERVWLNILAGTKGEPIYVRVVASSGAAAKYLCVQERVGRKSERTQIIIMESSLINQHSLTTHTQAVERGRLFLILTYTAMPAAFLFSHLFVLVQRKSPIGTWSQTKAALWLIEIIFISGEPERCRSLAVWLLLFRLSTLCGEERKQKDRRMRLLACFFFFILNNRKLIKYHAAGEAGTRHLGLIKGGVNPAKEGGRV